MGDLSWKVDEMHTSLNIHIEEEKRKFDAQEALIRNFKQQLAEMSDQIRRLERRGAAGGGPSIDSYDVKRVEWIIPNIDEKRKTHQKGDSIWSAAFDAGGISGITMEFFPNGRESTNIDGFCSLFLWCPSGTKIKYQLSVGDHLRAPDEDTYDGRMGHGHSNFCSLLAERREADDKCNKPYIVVAVDILDIDRISETVETSSGPLKCITGFSRSVINKQAEIAQNRSVDKVEWTINNISKKLDNLPRGSSMYSQLFTAAGINEILLEFYPNGSGNTTRDGHCAFYIRCPEGTNIIVTLFVGSFKKGPITASFDGSAGKGLPDFCDLEKQIDHEKDCVVVGLDIQNPHAEEENATLHMTS